MTQRDHDGRRRSGVWLTDEQWAWLDQASSRDGMSRSDLLEGLVLLAMDEDGGIKENTCSCEHHDDGSCVAAGDLLNAEHVIRYQAAKIERLRSLICAHDPDENVGPCVRCDHDPACGFASVNGDWLCHTDDHSCYFGRGFDLAANDDRSEP